MSSAALADLELELQAELFEHLATSPAAEVRRDGGALAVATGARANTLNGVVCSGLAGDADAVIADLVAWFGRRRLPASWVCPELGDLRDSLVVAGCREETSAVQIAFGLDAVPAAPTGLVEVDTVLSEPELAQWLDLAEACGWFESSDERRALETLKLSFGFDARRPWVDYVARADGRPVGFATAFFGRRALLLDAVGVRSEDRRRGVGTALVQARLADARRRGLSLAALGPSPDGARLYAALGLVPTPVAPGRWFYLPLPGDEL